MPVFPSVLLEPVKEPVSTFVALFARVIPNPIELLLEQLFAVKLELSELDIPIQILALLATLLKVLLPASLMLA